MESVIRITKTLRQQYLCFSLHELKAWGMNRKLYNYCILCLCCLLVAFYLVKTKCFIKMFLCCCNPCFKSLRIRPVKIGIGSAPDCQLVKKKPSRFALICKNMLQDIFSQLQSTRNTLPITILFWLSYMKKVAKTLIKHITNALTDKRNWMGVLELQW